MEIEDISKEYGIKDLKMKPHYINNGNRTEVTQTIAVMDSYKSWMLKKKILILMKIGVNLS